MLAQALDRVHADSIGVELDPKPGFELPGHILGADGGVELVFVVNPPGEEELGALELLRQGLGLGVAVGELGFISGTQFAEPGQFVDGGNHPELPGEEVVPGVAVPYVHHIAGNPEPGHLANEQHLHLVSLLGRAQW